jgi:signal transduction histidine kinase
MQISPSNPKSGEVTQNRVSCLALDIHDGPLQNLAVIGLDLNALHRRLRPLLPADELNKLDAGIEQLAEDLVEVERSLRTLIARLEHDPADGLSLIEGVEAEIAEFERRSDVRVQLLVEGDVEPDADSHRRTLRAIARSALANVRNHADARTVSIRIRRLDEWIILEIEDDGRGFDVADAYRPGHFGLRGMQERAELVGGHAEIRSRPGGPTLITATVVASDGFELSKAA